MKNKWVLPLSLLPRRKLKKVSNSFVAQYEQLGLLCFFYYYFISSANTFFFGVVLLVSLEAFLKENELLSLLPRFEENETSKVSDLLLLTDEDIKELVPAMIPRRKLLNALERYRLALLLLLLLLLRLPLLLFSFKLHTRNVSMEQVEGRRKQSFIEGSYWRRFRHAQIPSSSFPSQHYSPREVEKCKKILPSSPFL